MKRKTAKEILADSFHELAEDRQIDKITVREIAANCGYSSATFYRQFRDKYDLIAWDYAQQIEKVMSRIGIDGYTWKRALWDCLEHYQKERVPGQYPEAHQRPRFLYLLYDRDSLRGGLGLYQEVLRSLVTGFKNENVYPALLYGNGMHERRVDSWENGGHPR